MNNVQQSLQKNKVGRQVEKHGEAAPQAEANIAFQEAKRENEKARAKNETVDGERSAGRRQDLCDGLFHIPRFLTFSFLALS